MRLRSVLPAAPAVECKILPSSAVERGLPGAPAAERGLPGAPAAERGQSAAPAAEHCQSALPASRREPLRGRSSKVQHNVATMHRNAIDAPLPVLIELRPLARNNAETMPTALRRVIETVAEQIAVATQWSAARLIHCLVGDGIYTKAAAARSLWSWAAADPVAPHYRLLVRACSTHVANLVARTAVRDDAQDADSHPIVATRVPCFKYLMPEYAAEFAERLRVHVDARSQVHLPAPIPAVVAQ